MYLYSKAKSHFEQLLYEMYVRRPRGNNKQVCIDCLNQDQIKINLIVKIVVALNFMCSIIKILHLKYCPVCNVYNGSIVK